MRLSPRDITALSDAVHSVAGTGVRTRVFGSRADDAAKGGDVDIMVEFDTPIESPAALSARIAVRAMRALNGRNVDVLLKAPNLQEHAIHRIAMQYGIPI
jgi:predicted nucleotidyltransferase